MMSGLGIRRSTTGPRGPRGARAAAFGSVIVLAVALGAGATAAAADHGPAAAVTFQVNSFNDSHDAHPGDGRCADSVGVCSLRAAIEEASPEPAGPTPTILLHPRHNRLPPPRLASLP